MTVSFFSWPAGWLADAWLLRDDQPAYCSLCPLPPPGSLLPLEKLPHVKTHQHKRLLMRMGRDRAERKIPQQDKNGSIVEPNRAWGTESNSRAVNFSTDPGFLIIPDGHRKKRDGQKAGVVFQGKQKRRRYPAKIHPLGSQSQHGTQPISGKNQFDHSAASGIPVKKEGDKWKKKKC